MVKYVPSPRDWVREQVDLYENSGGTIGITLRDIALPVVFVDQPQVRAFGSCAGLKRASSLLTSFGNVEEQVFKIFLSGICSTMP
jgi:hypothetical protein